MPSVELLGVSRSIAADTYEVTIRVVVEAEQFRSAVRPPFGDVVVGAILDAPEFFEDELSERLAVPAVQDAPAPPRPMSELQRERQGLEMRVSFAADQRPLRRFDTRDIQSGSGTHIGRFLETQTLAQGAPGVGAIVTPPDFDYDLNDEGSQWIEPLDLPSHV